MRRSSNRASRSVWLLIGLLAAIWIAGLACNDVNITNSNPQTAATPCEADSLRQVIHNLEFIIGQQRSMINCLKTGGTDCNGGV